MESYVDLYNFIIGKGLGVIIFVLFLTILLSLAGFFMGQGWREE